MKAIIFDLDGVLVHTDQYHYQAWKSLADELNLPFDEMTDCVESAVWKVLRLY